METAKGPAAGGHLFTLRKVERGVSPAPARRGMNWQTAYHTPEHQGWRLRDGQQWGMETEKSPAAGSSLLSQERRHHTVSDPLPARRGLARLRV
jgi:hypothetical protein